jgi:hypothetical protein
MDKNGIDAWSCIDGGDGTPENPRCAPELYVGGKNGSLFVKHPPKLFCRSARSFDYGDFCMCQNRVQLFLTCGI